MANAAAYATLALGLNIVVGFAGLLDLGYAAFFAIGAYTYGILTVVPAAAGVERRSGSRSSGWAWSRRCQAERRPDVVHFTAVVLARAADLRRWSRAFFGVLFGAPTLRLRGDYLAIVTLGFGEIVPIVVRNWSDLTNGAAGLNGVAAPQLFGWSFGVDARPYYYVAIAHGGAAGLHQHPAAGFAHRPRLDGDPRGRDRRRRDGRQPRPSSSCWRSRSAPRSAA